MLYLCGRQSCRYTCQRKRLADDGRTGHVHFKELHKDGDGLEVFLPCHGDGALSCRPHAGAQDRLHRGHHRARRRGVHGDRLHLDQQERCHRLRGRCPASA